MERRVGHERMERRVGHERMERGSVRAAEERNTNGWLLRKSATDAVRRDDPRSRSGRPDRLFLRRHRATARTRRHRAQCVCLWCVPGGQPSRTAARSRGNTCVQRVRFGCCRLRGGRLSGPGVRGQPAGRGPPPACAHVRGSAALGGADGVRAVWFPFTVFAARACGVRARGRGRAPARARRPQSPGFTNDRASIQFSQSVRHSPLTPGSLHVV